MNQNLEYGLGLLRRLKLDSGANLGPLRVDIAPTSACNFHCKFCNWHSNLTEQITTFDTMKSDKMVSLVSDLVAMKTLHITLSGNGEPLLNPGTQEVIKHFGRRISVEVVTNGSLLDKITMPLFDNLSVLTISLNSADGSSHAALHGHSDLNLFTEIRENIERLLTYKNAPRKIKLNYVICKDNYAQYQLFADMANRWGVVTGVRQVSIDRPEFQPLAVPGSHNDGAYPYKLRPCYSGYIQPYIAANGDVLVCPGSGNKPLGNINQESFKVIWQKEQSIRLRHLPILMKQPYCVSCGTCPTPDLQSAQFHKIYKWIGGQNGQ